MKTLVIYCTHTLNNELKHFIDHGYFVSDCVDFFICLNGDFDVDRYKVDSKKMSLIFYKRPNVGHDFGGWGEILLMDKLYEHYDYFVLLNGTCLGPFLPVYVKQTWVELFTSMITNTVKLIGPTINHYQGKPHVQSYCMCTDRVGMQIGLDAGIFTVDEGQSKLQIIEGKEVGFSLKIMEAGYNIGCLLKAYDGVDFRKMVGVSSLNLPFGSMNGTGNRHMDPCKDTGYYMINFHPYEVIFFKSNRDIARAVINKYCQFHNRVCLPKNII